MKKDLKKYFRAPTKLEQLESNIFMKEISKINNFSKKTVNEQKEFINKCNKKALEIYNKSNKEE